MTISSILLFLWWASAQTDGRGWTLGLWWLDVPWMSTLDASQAVGSAANNGDALITNTIQTAINRILGILALIALLILMYAGFLMLTAAGDDEKYKKWFDILKQVALWLAFIGLAWLVVSMIFYVIDIIT